MILFCGLALLLASCAEKIDNPAPINPNSELTVAELQQAFVGLRVDVSDYVDGEDDGIREMDAFEQVYNSFFVMF